MVYLTLSDWCSLQYGASIDVVSCMKHVFCTFDLDTSGGLDLTELARLTEQLGEKMDDEEIRMVRDSPWTAGRARH